MALIKCPECGKEISDTAKNCIHCGYVIKEESNGVQPQAVVVVPEKGKSAKKSLDKGVTIVLIVMVIPFILYWFAYQYNIMDLDFGDQDLFATILGDIWWYASLISIVMSILIFSVPKLRKKWFEILYIIVSTIALPIVISLGFLMFPAGIAFVIGIVFIVKSMLIKE